jgi:uncharacterized protein with HEPN domain
MPRDYKVYADDIIEAIGKIKRYTHGIDREEFSRDEKTFDAVIRNLEVIGEAIKKMPEDIRAKHPLVEWKKIAGLRDIVVHEYFGIDVEIVWDVVQHKLSPLETEIKQILSKL